jgi:hypothetical protein
MRDDLDFAWRGWEIGIEGEQIFPRRAVLTAECSGGGGARAKQRVGAWLLVEDNMQCGGSMVTFTGLYRRN